MKVLAVNRERTEKIYDSFGKKLLYPNGTKRIVKRYRLFKGWVVYLEKCKVACACGSEGTVYYNEWRKVKVIPNDEHYQLMVKWDSSSKQ